ncbi:sigma 54-interacting transcriptional regulator, partial [Hyalangium minutum]
TGAFEAAHGGTLFLDEVGEMPLEVQAKLLRVLESGEVKPVGATRPIHMDVRVVAATHRDLKQWVHQGRFREDLYYRLNVLPVGLPPLRSRRSDIRLLAEHFVRLHAPREQERTFTPAALAKLQQHDWPGNIRELRNVVSRALLMLKKPQLDASDISFTESSTHRPPEDSGTPPLELPEGVSLEQMMQRLERQLIESTLRRYHYRKDHTAKALGLARSSLFKKLKQWGLGSEED